MGREILFRGKRLDNGKWVEGFYLGEYEYAPHHEILVPSDNFWEPWVRHVVDPDTVGQYTGLTDKNGVKIFEGDIVRVCLNPEICVGVVGYDERIAGFIVKFSGGKCVTFMDLYVGTEKVGGLAWVEVIGNIHDNPELLQEG